MSDRRRPADRRGRPGQGASRARRCPAEVEPPRPIQGDAEASALWREHAPALSAAGTLDGLNQMLFAGVCSMWADARSLRSRIAELAAAGEPTHGLEPGLADTLDRLRGYAEEWGLLAAVRADFPAHT